MSALIEPVDLEAGAVFLPAPTATALYEKDVHVRSTIATARRTGSQRTSNTRAGLTGCRTFFENIIVDRIDSAKGLARDFGIGHTYSENFLHTDDELKCVNRIQPQTGWTEQGKIVRNFVDGGLEHQIFHQHFFNASAQIGLGHTGESRSCRSAGRASIARLSAGWRAAEPSMIDH